MLIFTHLFLAHLLVLSHFLSSCHNIPLTYSNLDAFFSTQLDDSTLKEYGISSIAISVVRQRSPSELSDSDPPSSVLYFGGFGYENPDPQFLTNVTNRTIFGIASVSKTFVAVGALRMIPKLAEAPNMNEMNRLIEDVSILDLVPQLKDVKGLEKDLSVVIGDYYSWNGLPKEDVVAPGVTLRSLATHTSGIDENVLLWGKPESLRLDLQLDIEKSLPPLIRQPDQVATYSNYGISLIALAAEKANTKSLKYDQIVREELFGALGMGSTASTNQGRIYYGFENAVADEHIARQYIRDATTGKYEKFGPQMQILSPRPSGQVYASSVAMQKWATAFLELDPRLLETDIQWNALYEQKFTVGLNQGIDFILYEFESWGEQWKGHEGDISPYHAMMVLNRPRGIGLVILMTTRMAGIRSVLLDRFSAHFFHDDDGKEWCEAMEGGVLDPNGRCVRVFELSKYWPSTSETMADPALVRAEGCYVPSRWPHADWLKMYFMQRYLLSSAMCFEVRSDGHLRYQPYHKQANSPLQQEVLFLRRLPIDSNATALDFVMAGVIPGGQVAVDWTNGGHAAFYYDAAHRKYWMIAGVLGTMEYVADPSWYVFSWFFVPSWVSILFVAILIFLIVFVSTMCCMCFCCKAPEQDVGVDRYDRLGGESGEDEDMQSNLHLSTTLSEGRSVQRQHRQSKQRRVLAIAYIVTVTLSQTLILVSAFLNLLHYILIFGVALHSMNDLGYPLGLVKFASGLPVVSLLCLIAGILVGLGFLFIAFLSISQWQKSREDSRRVIGGWCHLMWMMLLLSLFAIGNSIYYASASEFNSFAHS